MSVKTYLQSLKQKGYAPSTIQRARRILAELNPRITRSKVEAIQSKRIPLKTCTKRSDFSALKRFLKQESPEFAKYVIIPKPIEELPKDIPSIPEMKEILQRPDITTFIGIRNKVILELLYGSGMRRSELIDLTLEDLNTEANTLRIVKGKGQKDRMVPISQQAQLWLNKYLNKVRPTFKPKTNHILIGKSGQKLAISRLWHIVKKYGKHSPHKYRHSFATHLLKGGMKEASLQRLLGHTQLSTTQIYMKVSPEDLKKSYAKYHKRDRWR